VSTGRRVAVTVGLVAVAVLATVLPAVADDLESYLAEAEKAEYAGSRIAVSVWDGNSEVGVYEVAHAGGTTKIGDGTGEALVGLGKVSVGPDAVAVPQWSSATLAERYTEGEPVPVRRLGRDGHLVSVLEGDLVRATIVFDDETGAPLATQVYDGDGSLFRYSAMMDFDDAPAIDYASLSGAGSEYDVMVPETDAALPAGVAGYVRADSYLAPDDTTHTFYSDGLFFFSVFTVTGPVDLDQFDGARELDADGHSYAVMMEPTQVWVTWQRSDTTYVLVGDLPPDHLSEVLTELPTPDRPNLLRRIWRGVFG
jgi:hypothetical protein